MGAFHLLRWVLGWVLVETEGGYPERLLNAFAKQEVSVWGVRFREERMRFGCFARDYRYLRRDARRACVRMRVRQKHGFPFWVHKYRRRKGMLVGLALYAVILALLSGRIWAIEVVGNTATPSQEILAVTQDIGVRIGAPMRDLQIKNLEIMGLNRLPTLAWISVNPSGCVARVEVTERKPTPQVLDLSQPSDMVAVRDGKIVSVTVVSGQKCVMVGEAVSAGTVLISGRVQSDLGEKLYRSYGEVWAQTERRITVRVPLIHYPAEADGFVAVCPMLTFLGWRIPLHTQPPTGEEYMLEEREHFLQANGLTLPLGVTNRYYIRTARAPVERTEQQALTLANMRLRAQETALFDGMEFSELDRTQTVQDGAVVLSVKYRCLENIAVEEPF